MASPQCEDGYLQIATELVDKFSSSRISGQEWQIIWTVFRKTWGWKKKIDMIPISQFAAATGIDRRKCHLIIKKLISKNILKKVSPKKATDGIISYGFNKNFETWKLSPKKAPVAQKGDKSVAQKGALKRKKEKDYSENSFEIETSKLLLNLILKRRPSLERPDIQKWAIDINKLLKREINPEEIKKVINWCQQDEFWQNNILSTSKLRKQFDQLSLKMETADAKPKRFDEEDF